jgi:hypothetical protein
VYTVLDEANAMQICLDICLHYSMLVCLRASISKK